MCMSCCNNSNSNGGRRINKRRIAILSIMGAGVAGAAYFSVTANPSFGASIPVILAFAACPAMCAAMGGAMWLRRRFSKKKLSAQVQPSQQEPKEVYRSDQTAKGRQHKDKLAVMVPETHDEKTVMYSQPQEQRRKRKVNAENHENVQ